MAEQVPVKRTVITLRDYARAAVLCWPGEAVPEKVSVAVLWAQYLIETGGTACWNYNVGNVKSVPGDGYRFHCLGGVWEGVTPEQATRLIGAGEAHADPSPDHAKAVGPSRVSVIFQPPHQATRFRAFESLDEAMGDHLHFLQRRFAKAWPAVLTGDYRLFAMKLKEQGYYTASSEAYANGMRRPYQDFLMSTGYEDTLLAMAQDAVATQPDLMAPTTAATHPTEYPRVLSEAETGSGATVHPLMYPLDVDPPDDDAA